MNFFTVFRVSLHALGRNPVRSFLSCLGIGIGIVAVILAMAIGQGAKTMMVKEISSMGDNLVMVFPENRKAGPVSSGMGQGQTLTAEDAELVSVRNMAGAIYDPEALLTESLDFPLSDEPMILIVHTHATEAYTPADGDDYSAAGSYRTTDTDHNVVRVGQALAQRLNDNGIPTLHDTTLHDVPGYDDAYERAAAVISRYLEEYPSIRMVIDVHRDAALDENGSEVAVNCSIGDREAAQMMLVMGTDAAGLEHPGWQGNLSMALKLQAWCEKTSPGCFRPLQLRAERYNQYLTPYSILLEVGAAGNTLRQALCSAEFFADRLTDLLLQG